MRGKKPNLAFCINNSREFYLRSFLLKTALRKLFASRALPLVKSQLRTSFAETADCCHGAKGWAQSSIQA